MEQQTPTPIPYCGPGCHLLHMHDSSSFLPRHHIDGEHTAKDDEHVKKVTSKLYKPLYAQQYRILKILPGVPCSSLQCKLHRATLTPVDGARLDEGVEQGNLVEYDALSYSWGRPARTSLVDCNDIQVPITPHLKNALCSLRHTHQARYVWTDALCINQLDNVIEKGEQVQLMFTIFKKARKVIGWLGSSEKRCEFEDLFTCLYFLSPRRLPVVSEPYALNRQYSQVDDPTCDCILTSLKWCAVRLVRQNEWFQRTWIRQEVFAAKKVEMRYGPYHFDLEALIQLIELVDDTHCRCDLQLFHELVGRHGAHAHVIRKSETCDAVDCRVATWLEAALSNAQGFQASDKRDLIFALQNIAQPEDLRRRLLFPTIDYHTPIGELFEQFHKRLMSSCNSLAPLSIFEDRRDFQSTGLPSWVVDWTQVKTRLAGNDRNHYLPYGHKVDVSRPGALSMDGVQLGVVTDVWPMHHYQSSLSASLGRNNRPFAFALHKVYRSRTSSLSGYRPFNDLPTVDHALGEIAYRPFKYITEDLTSMDGQRQPYVLASIVVQPGDILVSFAWEAVSLTVFGYERTTWCSALRRCPGEPGSYYYLGSCVFDHLSWHEPGITDYRRPSRDINKYVLV